MNFFKKIILLMTILGVTGVVIVVIVLKSIPIFHPCENFETYFSRDTLSFPREGAEVKMKFEGMKYDTLPPYFLYQFKNDTLFQAHFRSGYEERRFLNSNRDTSISSANDPFSVKYDGKGIYAYSFRLDRQLFEQTFRNLRYGFGNKYQNKISRFDKIPYAVWEIGPCHHLLLFKKIPFSLRHRPNPKQEYTYVLFAYNISEKEIEDMVEADGAIRNESIEF